MITIITPTYNRGYILPVLYQSLCKQSIKEFEWIIVDDGSTDDTPQIVEQWVKSTSSFDIIYIKTKNGGKHRALNSAIKEARYEYIYVIDSDDYLVEKGIELIHKWIDSIKDKEKFAGVSGLKASENGQIIGQNFKDIDYVDATNLERRKYNLLGDKAEVYRKDLLIKYPFPEFEGEKFIGEGVVWNKIASEGYKIRWFNEIICVCEYLEDGLTKDYKKNLDNFKGYTYVEKMNINVKAFPENLIAIGRYRKVAYLKGLTNKEIRVNLKINNFIFIFGVLFYFLNEAIKIIKHKIYRGN